MDFTYIDQFTTLGGKSFEINTFPAIITCDLTLEIYTNQKLPPQQSLFTQNSRQNLLILSVLCHETYEIDLFSLEKSHTI